jgi:DNA-binding response OmpR family regulator
MSETARARILLVDDDDDLRETTAAILEQGGFEVVDASSVNQALKLVASQSFDVLVSDLHMPLVGDGLTVVSAIRHINPKAITLIQSGFPEMEKAAAAILAQADEILIKPTSMRVLVDTIRKRLQRDEAPEKVIASVAAILEDEAKSTIADWLLRVAKEPHILIVVMDDKTRSAHLPQLFQDLVSRLRSRLPLGSNALESPAASAHGVSRRQQGYTAAMVVEESRLLQVSIFQTLQNNLSRINFSNILESVMVIADEVDSQLAQAMTAYVSESNLDPLPTKAQRSLADVVSCDVGGV